MRFGRMVLAVLAVVALAGGGLPTRVQADGNRPPIAVDDPAVPGCNPTGNLGGTFLVPEDLLGADPAYPGWLTILPGNCSPIANDTDPDGDPLTFEVVGKPANGDALALPGGLLGYKPDPNYSTIAGDQPGGNWISDVVTYRAFDGLAYSNEASYRFWVAPINDPPTFTPGPAVVSSHMGDGPVSVPWASDVSAGPANEAAQTVTFDVKVSSPGAPGMFAALPAVDGAGNLTFTPGSEPGLATVTVTAHDDGGLEAYGDGPWIVPPADTSAPATFHVVVYPPQPGPPVAVDDDLTVAEDGFATIDVLANDTDPNGDPLLVTDVGTPAKGTAAFALVPGTIRYAPDANTTGDDSFTYTVSDGHGGTAQATVHVKITPVNDPPLAADDSAVVAEGSAAITIPVLANDRDPDGDLLVVVAATGAAHGTVGPVSDGVIYQPDPGYNGDDSFTYTVSDGHGGTAHATVSVTIAPDTAGPVIATLVDTLPAQTIATTTIRVRIAWSATDVSGIAGYQLQVRAGSQLFHAVVLSPTTARSVLLALVPGTSYQVRVRATDGHGNVGAWTTMSGLMPVRRQESTSLASWSGSWSRAIDTRASGGASRRTATAGSRVVLRFTGRSVGWVGTRGPAGGRAQVLIDGVLVATVNLRGASTLFRGIVFRTALATAGPHRLEVRSLGGGRVDVDAFVVLP